jgi:HAD superfamily hydrolase (TIGR01549 family)
MTVPRYRGIIFDLDQTLVDSSVALELRRQRRWNEVYSLIPSFTVYDGLRDLLSRLYHGGIKLAVVTSSPAAYCNRVLKEHYLDFPIRVCYHDTKHHKPHPEPMHCAVKHMGLKPQEVISIGDEAKDILSARVAGLLPVAACWGKVDGYEFPGVTIDHVCNTVEELSRFVYKCCCNAV